MTSRDVPAMPPPAIKTSYPHSGVACASLRECPVDAEPAPRIAFSVTNDMAVLDPVRLRTRALLEAAGAGARTVYDTELVLEEVLTNVIRHAFRDHGQHRIDIELAVGPDAVVLAFADDGEPFDPRAFPQRRAPSSIEEAEAGGLGLVLVRGVAQAIDYERRNDRNHLVIRVPLE